MKKNCKETKTFFEERIRMCKEYNHSIGCDGCPFSSGEETFCEQMLWEEPEKAIDMMQKWSDDHQPETIEEHFYKVLPHASIIYDNLCCQILDYELEAYDDTGDCWGRHCKECWKRPYEESLLKGEK